MLKTCPRCGEKSSGFFRLCGICQQEREIDTGGKAIRRTEDEDEE